MYYGYNDPKLRGKVTALPKERVAEIKAMNKKGKKPDDLVSYAAPDVDEIDVTDFDSDVTGVIDLPDEKRRRKKKRKPSNRRKPRGKGNSSGGNRSNKSGSEKPKGEQKSDKKKNPRKNKFKSRKPKNKNKDKE